MKSRKELKAAYKQMTAIAGVFQIKNTKNGKVLIDASLDIPAKWNRFQTELKFGSCRVRDLQIDWNAGNADDFEFSILSELDPEDDTADDAAELKMLKELTLEELGLEKDLFY